MRRAALVLLILAAIGLYSYDAWLLFGMFVGRSSEGQVDGNAGNSGADTDFVLRAARVVRFEEKGRSPFLAHAAPPKPVAPVRPKRVVRRPEPAPEKKMPTISITGIMWNPANPVAMLQLSDGSSAVAKAGMTLPGGIVVKKVEKQGVRVVWEGREAFISK
jgi:type IV pilus biogenesis protein PilP